MARYNIKSVDLAKELNISPNAVSSLRKAKTMPRLDGNTLNNLCNALNKLAEDLDVEVSPITLIAYVRDPEPEQPQSESSVELSDQQINGNKRIRGSHSSNKASTQVLWLMMNKEVS